MSFAYFDFAGTPVRILLNDDGLPERCEWFDRATGEFVEREELTLDVWSGHGSRLIGEADFEQMLAKERARPA